MKNFFKARIAPLLGIIALVAVIGFSFAACDDGGGGNTHTHTYSTTWSYDETQHWHECTANDGAKNDVANHDGDPCSDCGYDTTATPVTFSSVTANGSSTATTTTLTLTFSEEVYGLAASNISLSGVAGVSKGTLSGSGPTYTLPISGFTAGGSLSVAVSKSGYNISGSPKSTTIYYYTSSSGPIPAQFRGDWYRQSQSAIWGNWDSYLKITASTLEDNSRISGMVEWDPDYHYITTITRVEEDASGGYKFYFEYDTGAETITIYELFTIQDGNLVIGNDEFFDTYTKTAPWDNGGNNPGGSSQFNGAWTNESDATDIITINSPNWTRTKGNAQAGTLDFDNAPSSDEPNILDSTGGNIGWAKINGGKLEWGINGSGTTTFAKDSGNSSGNFVAVTNITGVPTTATAGTALTLTGTVVPSTATNKTIAWSVVNGSATISGNTLNATAAGTVTVRATIANGTAQGTNYTKNFTITVSASGGGGGVSYETVYVSGGSFQMGNPDSSTGRGDEYPVHTVTLTGFYMGKYEVTQAQYEAVIGRTITQQQTLAGEGSTNYGRGNDHPMYFVSWYDALVFCNKLSVAEGFTPAYSIVVNDAATTNPAEWGTVPTSNNPTWNAVTVVAGSTGYRLPTEAQWEYAAKGGPSASNPVNVWAGVNSEDTLGNYAWYGSNSESKAHEVGEKLPNELGIYDMSGNVWEWCWDWYGDYSDEAQTDPVGVSSGYLRVLRGGSWYVSAEDFRSTFRSSNFTPTRRDERVGFRVLRP